MDFLWLKRSFRSEQLYQPHAEGTAIGAPGLRVDLGYALSPRLRIGLTGWVGWTRSDFRPEAVVSWASTASVRYSVLGRPGGWAALYVGAEAGAGAIHATLPVGMNNERDVFTHRYGLLGGLLGVELGHPRVAWFAELAPGVVFPHQTTFRLLLVTGLRLFF